MADSPEERRSKEGPPPAPAKEAEPGKTKKEKKDKSAEGKEKAAKGEVSSAADKWRIIWPSIDSTMATPRIATATGHARSGREWLNGIIICGFMANRDALQPTPFQ